MKKVAKKSFVYLAIFALVASFTSCNRGYGCPNSFSVNDTITEIVADIADFWAK